MTPTSTSTSPASRRSARRDTDVSNRRRRSRARRERTGRDHPLLGRYSDLDGQAREVIARPGAAGSTLVIDRYRATHGDARLVAHLAADEPAENAALVCSRYLQDAAAGASRCRLLTREDASIAPFADQRDAELEAREAPAGARSVDRLGRCYSLELVHSGMSIPELRWCRRRPGAGVRMRAAELARGDRRPGELRAAARAHAAGARVTRPRGQVSTTVLRAELARVQESPIVLNRRLREVVLARVERERAEHERDRRFAAGASSATDGETRVVRPAGWPGASACFPRAGAARPRRGYTATCWG